jgi:sec-independent protein translocase protein TatC
MLFCYFLLLPNAIRFLVTFGENVIDNQLRAADYLAFVTTFILAMGLVFEIPAIVFALVRVGILSRRWLAARRRYVILLVFFVGAIITPTPDPFNQMMVAIPMYLLYELGLLLARVAEGRRAAS